MTCSGCGTENRAGARFCRGCGAALAPRCSRCGAEAEPDAHFCDSCGTALGTAVEARKTVTIVFADLVGSTSLQEKLDPETARRVIERFTSTMADVVEEHGGRVVKTMGDGLMAAFGIPAVREDDAPRGVRAALAMHERLVTLNDHLARERGVRLAMRVGANTGEVVVGADGDAVGDAVNLAARLEGAAPPGGVLVGEQTYRLARDAVAFEEVEPLAVRGKARRQRAWLVLGAAAPAQARSEAPFVARQAELTRLDAVFAAAQATGAARLVTVVGSPGMGKTRLTSEFASGLGDRARVVEGRCEPSGEGITFMPVAEALRAVAGIEESDVPDVARARLLELLPTSAEDRERVARLAAGVLGLAEAGLPEEVFWAVRRTFEAAAAERPLVVVFDDVHWGQPQFLDLIEHLAGWATGAPLLVVAIARPELRDIRPVLCARGRLVADVVELDALDTHASRALVDALLGGDADGIGAAIADRLQATAEGNPLFLGETVRMLVEDGALRREDGRWVADGDSLDVPPTINALLAARIERLGADEREVVERASVIGKSFYRGAVAALTEPTVAADLDDHLETLRRREMVEPDGTMWIDEPVFRFHHVLIRDAAYRALLKEARAELHERFADWLVEKAAQRIGEHEEVVAYHLEQAHEYRRQLGPLDDRGRELGARAALHLGSCGRRALAREDLAAACNLLERALLSGEEDTELLLDLIEAFLSSGDAERADAALERLSVAAGRDRRLRARVAVAGVQLGRLTGEIGLHEAEIELTRAADVLAGAGDDAGLAKALELRARAIAPLGRIAEAESVLDRALAAARRAGDQRRVTAVLSTAPIVALYGPSPVPRASGRCLDVVRILRMGQGNRHVEARALRCQAVLEAMRGRGDAARAILDGARATFEELGLRLDLLELEVYAGMVELALGDAVAAEHRLREAADGLGASAGLPTALLALALTEQGRHEEAIAATERAEALAGDDLQTTVVWQRVRAQALARTGELDRAEALARRAVALAEATDALAEHADCRLTLAAVLRAADRADEAVGEATRAAELYAAKGHEVGVARARELGAATDQSADRAASAAEPAVAGPATGAPAGAAIREGRAARVMRCAVEAIAARDWDAIAALHAEGYVGRDRRGMSQPPMRGVPAARDVWRSILTEDTVLALDILGADERVTLVRTSLTGTGSGDSGAFEYEYLAVHLCDGDRWVRADVYDVEDESAARARFGELRAQTIPEVLMREWMDLVLAHDWDAMPAMYSADYAFVDHRPAGWEPTDGPGIVAVSRSMMEAFPLETELWIEPLAGDDVAALLRFGWSGKAAEGGGYAEFEVLELVAQRDGLLTRAEFMAADDEAGGRTRLAELQHPERANDTDDRAAAVFHRLAAAFAARDWDGYACLLAPGAVLIDHSPLGETPLRGPQAFVDSGRSVVALAPDALWRPTVLESTDRVALVRMEWTGTADKIGSEFEWVQLSIGVVSDGALVRAERWSRHDIDAARARYVELCAARLPDMVLEDWIADVQGQDRDAVATFYREDFKFVDHRLVGWESDLDGRPALARSMREAFRDPPAFAVQPLGGDDRARLYRCGRPDVAIDGDPVAEFEMLMLLVIEGGLGIRCEHFALDDESAARARLGELGSGAPSPAAAIVARYAVLVDALDFDRIIQELFTEDCVIVDRRPLGAERVRGHAALRRYFDAWASLVVDVDARVSLLADHGDVFVMKMDGGLAARDAHGAQTDVEMDLIDVCVVRDGRIWLRWRHETADAALAQAALLTTPPVRLALRYIAAANARDWAGARAVLDPAFTVDDRRLAIGGTFNRDAVVERSRHGLETADAHIQLEDVIAADDDGAVWYWATHGQLVEGAGDAESVSVMAVWMRGSQLIAAAQFEPDQVEEAQAWLAEQRATAEPAALAAARRIIRCHADRDWDGMRDIFAAALDVTDHRRVGFGRLDRDGWLAHMRELVELVPDAVAQVQDVHLADDVVALVSVVSRGTQAGAVVELPFFFALLLADGKVARAAEFDVDALEDARDWCEQRRDAGTPEPESLRLARRLAEHPPDRDLLAPTFEYHDHRPGATGTTDTEALELLEVLEADDRFIAAHVREPTGAAHVIALEVHGGRILRMAAWPGDQHERARAWCAYARLAPHAPLDTAPAWLTAIGWTGAINGRDWSVLDSVVARGCVAHDHRLVGFGARPREQFLAEIQELTRMADDVRWEPDAALAFDDTHFAGTCAWVGTRDGGAFEIPFAAVIAAGPAGLEHVDIFAAEATDDVLARFAELGGEPRPLRRMRHIFRAHAARDWDGIRAESAATQRNIDHRAIGWGTLDREGMIDVLARMCEVVPDVHVSIEEVLFAGERSVAVRLLSRGHGRDGGAVEIELAVAAREDADGRTDLFAQWDGDDAEEARLWAMHADIAPHADPETPFMRDLLPYAAAINKRDWERIAAAYGPACALVDHRLVGWGTITPAEHVLRIRSMVDLAPDARVRLKELFAATDRGALQRVDWHGTSHEGAEFEIEFLVAWTIGDRGFKDFEIFEADDVDAARARFAELVGTDDDVEVARLRAAYVDLAPASDPGSPVAANVIRLGAALTRRDWVQIRQYFAADATVVDHRPMGWGTISGGQHIERFETLYELAPDARFELRDILADGPRGALLRAGWAGAWREGAEFEIDILLVYFVGGGRLAHLEMFDVADVDAARARFAELAESGGGN